MNLLQNALLSAVKLLLASVLLSPSLLAQDSGVYKGPFLLRDSIRGTAEYAYKLKAGDTLLHGPFRYQTTNYQPENGRTLRSLQFKGQYANGGKDGDWQYRSLQLRLNTNPRVEGNQAVFSGTGKEHRITGPFDQGLPSGVWQVLTRKVRNGTPGDTTF